MRLIEYPLWLDHEVLATVWTEDDADLDSESIEHAFNRIFELDLKLIKPDVCFNCGSPEIYYAYKPNKVICRSYKGNNKIYVLTRDGINSLIDYLKDNK